MTAIVMVTIDCANPARLAEFWTEALGAKIVHTVEDQFLVMAPEAQGRPLLGLQRVPEPKAGKNRVHVDLITEDREAEVRRLVGLGATELDEHKLPGYTWTVLVDPDGNEFCIGSEESQEEL
jgi:catechol 2,3-dioxygenase-like lactoylglutathione lyase family enzyme